MSLITIDRSLIASEAVCEENTAASDKNDGSSKSSQSEDFLMCKGTAIGLNIRSRRRSSCIKTNDDTEDHLKRIMVLLRFGDYIQLMVRLQNTYARPHHHRYCCFISTNGKQETEESAVLGVDITDGKATIGLVLPIWQDMSINLCGDGGFELVTKDTVKQFKPVSVQALWAAFQAVNKACQIARANAYFSRGFTHDWISYYNNLPSSTTYQVQEWLKTDDIDEFNQPPLITLSNDATDEEKERMRMEALIRIKLQEIMYTVDLEDVTVLQLRKRLEDELHQSLLTYRHFIEKQILTIYGQMDEASLIFDHLLLGTTFNASNRDELDRRNVTHILNITREVDNFFPNDRFEYKNIRVFDDEQSSLLPYWEETHRFINEAKTQGTRCLVHCKMGISRSASTAIAYAMKEHNWDLETAFSYVKCRRPCVQPNPTFMKELQTYQGILEASSNRHKLIFCQDTQKVISRTNATPAVSTMTLNNLNQYNNNVNTLQDYSYVPHFRDYTTTSNIIDNNNFDKTMSTNLSYAKSIPSDFMTLDVHNLDLESELFAFKPGSNDDQTHSLLNFTQDLSRIDTVTVPNTNTQLVESSLLEDVRRPRIVWDFEDLSAIKPHKGENPTILAQNFQCLYQWHPDLLENRQIFTRRISKSNPPVISASSMIQGFSNNDLIASNTSFTKINYAELVLKTDPLESVECTNVCLMDYELSSVKFCINSSSLQLPLISYPTILHNCLQITDHRRSVNSSSNAAIILTRKCVSNSSNSACETGSIELLPVSSQCLEPSESPLIDKSSLVKCTLYENVDNTVDSNTTVEMISAPINLCPSPTTPIPNLIVTTSPDGYHVSRDSDAIMLSPRPPLNQVNFTAIDTSLQPFSRRKFSFTDVKSFYNLDNDQPKSNRPERSLSSRSSYRTLSSRLRPDDSWITLDTSSSPAPRSSLSTVLPSMLTRTVVTSNETESSPATVTTSTISSVSTLACRVNKINVTANLVCESSQNVVAMSKSVLSPSTDKEPNVCMDHIINTTTLTTSVSNQQFTVPSKISTRKMKLSSSSASLFRASTDNITHDNYYGNDPSNGSTSSSTSYLNYNRPLRRIANWPPRPIDPMATESYCS